MSTLNAPIVEPRSQFSRSNTAEDGNTLLLRQGVSGGEIADEEDDEVINVLDLPPIYLKPSPQILRQYLYLVALAPPSWSSASSSSAATPKQPRIEGSPTGWLTTIIASPLHWIEDDAEREHIRSLASTRLAERCGRTAMPSVTRSFVIYDGDDVDGEEDKDKMDLEDVVVADLNTGSGVDIMLGSKGQPVEVTLHEPTLDGDNLGLKTWGAAYLLARNLRLKVFVQLLNIHKIHLNTTTSKSGGSQIRILELGSGTGLAGISAALLLPRSKQINKKCGELSFHIHLTDLPEIVPNLQKNINLNTDQLPNNVTVATDVLDWRDDTQAPSDDDRYPIILVADPLYSKEHPEWLTNVVAGWLERNNQARLVVELPLREKYMGEVEDFWRLMKEKGFEIVVEGRQNGRDDWGDGEIGEEMLCWWGVYSWKSESPRE